jgi:hypothetical protein
MKSTGELWMYTDLLASRSDMEVVILPEGFSGTHLKTSSEELEDGKEVESILDLVDLVAPQINQQKKTKTKNYHKGKEVVTDGN